MKYYKNIELAREYNVSLPTIGNWIKDSLQGKKSLQIISINGRNYIEKSEYNAQLFKQYVSQGFKFKPHSKRIITAPRPTFLKCLSGRQIIEIKKNLEEKNRIDLKFAYIDEGAHIWNTIYTSSTEASCSAYDSYNTMNQLAINRLLNITNNKPVNLIDLGCGNGKPVTQFLQEWDSKKLLTSYTAIDISRSNLDLTETYFKEMFPHIDFYRYEIDCEATSFEDIVYEIHQQHTDSINIFLLLGGTLGNFINPFDTINKLEKSMMKGDMLYISNRSFDPDRVKEAGYMFTEPTSSHYLFTARSLGMNVTNNDLVYRHSSDGKLRQMYIRIPQDHSIEFNINNRIETVEILKGTEICVWQHLMTDLAYVQKATEGVDLELILYTISHDAKFNLTVFRK